MKSELYALRYELHLLQKENYMLKQQLKGFSPAYPFNYTAEEVLPTLPRDVTVPILAMAKVEAEDMGCKITVRSADGLSRGLYMTWDSISLYDCLGALDEFFDQFSLELADWFRNKYERLR